jgi:cell division septation protein DedD
VAPPTIVTPAKPDKPAQGDAGFRLQVAATKDEGAAQSEWARLRKAHADLLGDLSLTVVRADLGDKGVFYRLQAGVIPDRAAAEKLCAQLRAVSIGCILVKAQ